MKVFSLIICFSFTFNVSYSEDSDIFVDAVSKELELAEVLFPGLMFCENCNPSIKTKNIEYLDSTSILNSRYYLVRFIVSIDDIVYNSCNDTKSESLELEYYALYSPSLKTIYRLFGFFATEFNLVLKYQRWEIICDLLYKNQVLSKKDLRRLRSDLEKKKTLSDKLNYPVQLMFKSNNNCLSKNQMSSIISVQVEEVTAN